MFDFNNQYMHNDQPMRCPLCLRRSDIICDLSHTNAKVEIHECYDKKCNHLFVALHDEEIYNYLDI